MKGTEKQITWATEIRTNVINTLTAAMPILSQIAPSQEAAEMATKLLQTRIDALNAADVYAGDIIELFKDVRFNGDIEHDFGNVEAVYRVGVTYTASQRAILGK